MTGESGLDGPRQDPASGGPAKQLIVLLHGVGADGNDLIGLAPALAPHFPDAAFVAPDGPQPCDFAPFGRQWFSLQSREEDALLAGVKAVEPVLNAFIDEELERHQLTADSLALVGFSQGTMTSLHVALRRPTPVAALVGFSGMLVAPRLLEAEIASRPPVLLVHGEADHVVPFAAMGAAEAALAKADVPVRSFARPGMGHGIDPEGLALAARHLAEAFGLLNQTTD